MGACSEIFPGIWRDEEKPAAFAFLFAFHLFLLSLLIKSRVQQLCHFCSDAPSVGL